MYVVCDGCYDMLLVVSGGSVFDFCCMVEVLYDCMLFDVFVLFFDDWCVVVVVLLLQYVVVVYVVDCDCFVYVLIDLLIDVDVVWLFKMIGFVGGGDFFVCIGVIGELLCFVVLDVVFCVLFEWLLQCVVQVCWCFGG